ncbi:hypothetical protein FANTH_2975 [Fusarium anthophilum]|uniref:Apple domain-containing protein n=1 Tax=Fusarium anthophilum TaxID=48485 RepID=A0A8H5E9V0_9HYPO|nr:hypothetical protein FANTH_2975 [Fusarium anthophilum]
MWSTSAIFYLGVLGLLRGCSANGQESCVTIVATAPLGKAVPTVTQTRTVTGKLQVIVNRTPVPQSTDVVTSTTVTTSVTTSTSTSITTSSTSTDSTSTLTLPGSSTISTPAGFTPIFSSLPNSASKKKKRHAIRGAASPLVLKSKRAPKTSPKTSLKTLPKTYPKQVNCLTTVTSWMRSTVIRTATKAQFVTRDPVTTTISTTKTLTSTSWLSTPDALSTSWTTSTVPSTFVTTSTTTTFSTSTNTVVVPTYTATVYAQCVDNTNGFANNIAGTENTFGIQSASVPYAQGYYQAYSSSATTPLACCNACAALPLCAMSEFDVRSQAGRKCLLIISSHATCAFGDYTGQAALSVNGQTIASDTGLFLSNGNCGTFNSYVN